MVKRMRSFIGIDFSRELKKSIADFQSELKKYADSGRWKYVDNFHLTLKFLGEIDLTQMGAVIGKLSEVCEGRKSFILKPENLGFFLGNGNLRVLWLALGGDMDSLKALQKDIDLSLTEIGFKPEKRPFTPHITIGQDVIFNESFDDVKRRFRDIKFPGIIADRIILFRSDQIGHKRVYTPVKTFKLV